ncbi:Cytochrome P450 [Mycena chlorophos]|uniref:Cytochrome P450 n=1 Tax=Mycena chlorophos TaxID=658473 RepID=A0A8H6W6Z5_MYCCL|nr:Cytochrome P450 [Mycena chlorophos]
MPSHIVAPDGSLVPTRFRARTEASESAEIERLKARIREMDENLKMLLDENNQVERMRSEYAELNPDDVAVIAEERDELREELANFEAAHREISRENAELREQVKRVEAERDEWKIKYAALLDASKSAVVPEDSEVPAAVDSEPETQPESASTPKQSTVSLPGAREFSWTTTKEWDEDPEILEAMKKEALELLARRDAKRRM